MISPLRGVSLALVANFLMPFVVAAQPSYEDLFDGVSLSAVWQPADNYAQEFPQDVANHASFGMTGTQLSISFPAGADHNMWEIRHAQVTRPFLGSGTYETKIDWEFNGVQEVGLIFESADHRTFMIFMLLSYMNGPAKAYVERFSYVDGEIFKKTFQGGEIGRFIPSPGPYYLRVTVDDQPLPEQRTWHFEWSTNGENWTELVAGALEETYVDANIGAIQKVGLFAGNAPQVLFADPLIFDGFDARFDYFRYYLPGTVPIATPTDVVARATDARVDLWWSPAAGADGYAVYGAMVAGGPYVQLGTTIEPSYSHLSATNGMRHYYVVKALESGIEGPASSEVDAVPHALGALATLPTDGLELLLSASELAYTHESGEPVTAWPTALSGTSVAVGDSANAPTFVSSGINGSPAVRFDGLNDFMTLSGTYEDFTQGVSIFIVAKPVAATSGFKYLLLGNGPTADGFGLGNDVPGSGFQYFAFNQSGGVGWFSTNSGLLIGESSLVSLVQDGAPAGSTSYALITKNGVPLSGSIVDVPSVASRFLNYIGRSYWGNTPFSGDIAEIIVYNRKLSAAEQAAVHTYAAVKYNLPVNGVPGAPPPLPAPASLTAMPGNNHVELSWAPVSGATGYRVYRAVPSQPVAHIASIATTSYDDSAVTNAQTYLYTVTAIIGVSESAYSNSVAATPNIPPPPPPPSNVVTRSGDNRVDLWWDAVAGADHYVVYAAAAPGGPYTQIGISVVPSFSHLGAENGSHNYYLVKAYNDGVEGAVSLEVEAVPHAAGALATLPTEGLALLLSASELAYTHDSGEPVTIWPTALGGTAVAFGNGANAPTFVSSGINGSPAVRFDGVNDRMTLSGAFENFTQGMSVFVVAKPAAVTSGFKYLLLGNGPTADGVGLGSDVPGGGLQYFAFNQSGGVGWFSTISGLVNGESSLVSLVQNGGAAGSSSYALITKNGIPLSGSIVDVPSVAPRFLNYIGHSYWGDAPFNGDIAEIIVYNRKLSTAEQIAVRSYAAIKYGLPIDENAGAPTSLNAVGGDNSVALTWAPILGATGYRVYRTDPSQITTLVASVTTASYIDTTVANGLTYSYRVTAHDEYSESPQSSAVQIIPSAPAPISASIPANGLMLALDALTALQDFGNNQPVTVWRDSSVGHHHAMTAGANPVVVAAALNGNPVVRFDGVDDYMTLASGFADFSAGMALFMVVKPTSLPSSFKLLVLGNGREVHNIGLSHAGTTTGLLPFINSGSGGMSWFQTGPALVSGEVSLLSLTQQGTFGGFAYTEVAENGTTLGGQTMFGPPQVERSQNFIGHGHWGDATFHGEIAEILLYNRALTVEEQTAVQQYLSAKYGVVSQ